MDEHASDSDDRTGKSAAAFRTISEVADELDVAQHVLRFWEGKFPQVKPLKRGGGRRYYRPEDVVTLREIQSLLYSEGYTIKGAQKLLRQKRGMPAKTKKEPKIAANILSEPAPTPKASLDLTSLRDELRSIRAQLDDLLEEAD